MILRYISILMPIIYFLGCTPEKSAPDFDHAQFLKEISGDLHAWNLKAKVEVDLTSDSLGLAIKYYPKDSFYFDEYTNELIVKTLMFNQLEKVNQFRKVNLLVEFEGYPDYATFPLSSREFKVIGEFYKDSSFYRNVIYGLENFNVNDLYILNGQIRYVVKVVDQFSFKGNFWELMESASSFFSGKDVSKKKDAELLIVLCQMIKHVNYDDYLPENTYFKLQKMLVNYGLPPEIMDMHYDEVSEFLKELPGKNA